MTTESSCDPVIASDVQGIVGQLRELTARAAENHQTGFHFILCTAEQSLADNLETILDMDAEDE